MYNFSLRIARNDGLYPPCSVLISYSFGKVILVLKSPWYFAGYLTGSEEYFTHERCFGEFCGMDLRENTKPARAVGIYSTHLFTDRVTNIIKSHSTNNVS